LTITSENCNDAAATANGEISPLGGGRVKLARRDPGSETLAGWHRTPAHVGKNCFFEGAVNPRLPPCDSLAYNGALATAYFKNAKPAVSD
jgi:hypothetical protein